MDGCQSATKILPVEVAIQHSDYKIIPTAFTQRHGYHCCRHRHH